MWFWCFWTHRIRKCPIIDTISHKNSFPANSFPFTTFMKCAAILARRTPYVYATMYVTILRYVKPSILFSKVVLFLKPAKQNTH